VDCWRIQNILVLNFVHPLHQVSLNFVTVTITTCDKFNGFRYIGTYYNREGIDFGCFKRDVMLFKNVALVQTVVLLIISIRDSSPAPFVTNAIYSIDAVTIAMVIGGYWISILATIALGIDRTYFGWELGICESKWITDFPYGYVFKYCWVFALIFFFQCDSAPHDSWSGCRLVGNSQNC
jgi:hypothetical protein